jgi:hypothetical protein
METTPAGRIQIVFAPLSLLTLKRLPAVVTGFEGWVAAALAPAVLCSFLPQTVHFLGKTQLKK